MHAVPANQSRCLAELGDDEERSANDPQPVRSRVGVSDVVTPQRHRRVRDLVEQRQR
jgi:hypothetical protein